MRYVSLSIHAIRLEVAPPFQIRKRVFFSFFLIRGEVAHEQSHETSRSNKRHWILAICIQYIGYHKYYHWE